MRCVWYISSDVLYTKAYLGLGVTLRHDHVRVRRYKLILGHNPFISDGFWDESYTRCTLSRGYLTWVWPFCIFALWGHIFLIRDWFWRCFFYLELTHFEMMYSYWGIATSLILTSCLWMLLSMDYRDDDILGSVSSAHLVRRGYPFTYVTHLYILPLTPLYLHLSHFARALLTFHFESTFFYHPIGSYSTFSIRGEGVGRFWVFWLSVCIPLDIRFNIFHDGRAY